MVHAKVQELKQMFNTHYSFYIIKPDSKNNSQRLLLFYAVECGLKVLILKKIKGNTTESITTHLVLKDKLSSTHGHNIAYMLKFLGYGTFSLPELRCLNGYCAPSHEYNQVWRYGIGADIQKQQSIERELCKIAEWIKGVL